MRAGESTKKASDAGYIGNKGIGFKSVFKLTATPEVAQETHEYVRSWFKENYDASVADAVIIQYGGSVNDGNVDELMACPDIDGALVGGASLKTESFGRIVNFVQK